MELQLLNHYNAGVDCKDCFAVLFSVLGVTRDIVWQIHPPNDVTRYAKHREEGNEGMLAIHPRFSIAAGVDRYVQKVASYGATAVPSQVWQCHRLTSKHACHYCLLVPDRHQMGVF